MGGDSAIRPYGLSDRIPHSVDTEISPSHPESWREGIPGKTFSEGVDTHGLAANCNLKGGPFNGGKPFAKSYALSVYNIIAMRATCYIRGSSQRSVILDSLRYRSIVKVEDAIGGY